MELQNQNGVPTENGTVKEITTKAKQNGEAKKDQANPKAEAANPKATPAKDGTQEAPKSQEPNVEPSKTEQIHEQAKPAKLALNLEGTLKVVGDLHRRSIQRLNLISRIKQLEGFEVTLTKENDELEDNPYQGCKLIIEDDKHRQFITTTPGLIRLVSQFIFDACHGKLAEIEASIVFPNA